jgi:hypothetical protein
VDNHLARLAVGHLFDRQHEETRLGGQMKYIIDRQTWYRGQGSVQSALLKEDGRRCCIGFVGKQCGLPDADLMDVPDVRNAGSFDAWPAWFETGHSDSLAEAYKINDSATLNDASRESQLKALFAEQGDILEFIN